MQEKFFAQACQLRLQEAVKITKVSNTM